MAESDSMRSGRIFMPTSGNNLETAAAGAFRTTHWTVVLSAHPNSPTADQALAQLYQQYSYPVYVYIRCEGMTPERAFDRRWALTVLANALAQLKTEYAHADKNGVFDRLQIFLSGEKHPASCEEVAAELSMTEAGLRVAVYRMRQRYGKL